MVYASDEYHLHVHSQTTTYLSEQQDEFEGFITNEYNNSINAYIQGMPQDGHWADNPIIRVTVDALNIEIHIVSCVLETSTITFTFRSINWQFSLNYFTRSHSISPLCSL